MHVYSTDVTLAHIISAWLQQHYTGAAHLTEGSRKANRAIFLHIFVPLLPMYRSCLVAQVPACQVNMSYQWHG